MPYDPEQHHRRSIRLKGYDYSQPGGYFVTIVTQGRTCLFGEVVDGDMRLNEYGKIVQEEWFKTTMVRQYVRLHPDEFVVMPNHVHGIIWIADDDNVVGARRRRAPTTNRFGQPVPGSIPTVVGAFKFATTKRINQLRGTKGAPIWQRNYYEHIIRTEESLDRIRRYIAENPLYWHLDSENPSRAGTREDRDALFGS